MEEVLARLRALVRRAAGHATAEFHVGPVTLDTRSSKVIVDGSQIKLTSHEYRLLAYLMHHQGRVVSRRELVEHLYDQDFDRDFEYNRGFHRPVAQEIGRRHHRNRPRSWLSDRQVARGRALTLAMRRARVNSLAWRLLLSAAALSFLILLSAGLILSRVNTASVTHSFDERLRLYLKVLVADVAAMTDGATNEIGNLGEPQFQIPLSGWYWQIVAVDQERGVSGVIHTSRSLVSAKLPYLIDPTDPNRKTGLGDGYITGPDNRRLRILEQLIDLGDDHRFYIAVAGNAVDIDDETRQFNTALAITFLLLGVLLVASTFVQVGFGLRPLARLRRSVTAIREGDADSIGADFPQEVAPLAHELNQLLEANREIVDRARMQVGNLAHALKTPISVLVNEASADDSVLAAKLREQTGLMKDQVQYYLDRARAATRAASVGSVTEVDPVITAFLRTFPKVYRDRAITFEATGDPGLRFRGERQDFEDIVGNLVDNAGKWARKRVEITVTLETVPDGAPKKMRLTIDDDGPGLAPESRARRGKARPAAR